MATRAGAGRIDYGIGIYVYDQTARGAKSAQRSFRGIQHSLWRLYLLIKKINYQYGLTSALFGKVGRFVFAGYAIRSLGRAWFGTVNMIEQSRVRLGQAVSLGFEVPMEKAMQVSSTLFDEFLDDARRQIGTVEDRINVATLITTPMGLAGKSLEDMRTTTNKLIVASATLGISYQNIGGFAQRWLLGSAKSINKLTATMTAFYVKAGVLKEGQPLSKVFKTYKQRAEALQNFLAKINEKFFGYTMEAKVETLMDNIKTSFAKASMPMWEAVKKVLDQINDWWFEGTKKGGVIDKWFSKFSVDLLSAFRFIRHALGWIAANWDRILPAIKLATSLTAISAALSGLRLLLTSPIFSVGILAALSGFGGMGGTIDKLSTGIQAIIEGILSGGYVSEKLYNKLKGLGIWESIQSVWGGLKGFWNFFLDIGRGFGSWSEYIVDAFKRLGNSFTDAFGSVKKEDFNKPGEAIGKILAAITIGIIEMIRAIMDLIGGINQLVDITGSFSADRLAAEGKFFETPSDKELKNMSNWKRGIAEMRRKSLIATGEFELVHGGGKQFFVPKYNIEEREAFAKYAQLKKFDDAGLYSEEWVKRFAGKRKEKKSFMDQVFEDIYDAAKPYRDARRALGKWFSFTPIGKKIGNVVKDIITAPGKGPVPFLSDKEISEKSPFNLFPGTALTGSAQIQPKKSMPSWSSYRSEISGVGIELKEAVSSSIYQAIRRAFTSLQVNVKVTIASTDLMLGVGNAVVEGVGELLEGQ